MEVQRGIMKNKVIERLSFFGNMLNRGHSRTVKARKNILASFVIRGCNIAISLILVPLTIHYINPGQYGIWLTLSSIIGWLSFFDIGFGNGLKNKFAEALATGNLELARIYLSTTYAILAIIMGMVLLLFNVVNPFLNWSVILNAPPEMASQLSTLALLVFSFFCIQFVLQLITTIITANQQPAKASFFNLLGSVISLGVIIILTKTTSGNIVYLGLVLGLAPVVVLLAASIWFYNGEYRQYAPSFKHVHFSYARNLMSLGIKFFFIQIAAIILYETSNLIIAQLYGPAQVTSYNVAYKYFGVIPMVMGIIMTPFWSAFTEAWVKKDLPWIKGTVKKLTRLWLLLSVLAVIMLLLAAWVYRLWVGEEVMVPFTVSVTIAAYVIINGWNSIYSQFLNGVGKVKLQLYLAVIGSIINIPLAIFLGKTLGIYGVVLSTTIISIVSAVVTPLQYRKLVLNRATGIWNK